MSDPSLFDAGPPPPCPARFNMAAHVLGPAAATSDKTALIVMGDAGGGIAERWSFGELDRAVRATASALRANGLGLGERVAIRVGNSSAFPILFFGTIAAGGVAVPVSTQLTARELAQILAAVEPRIVASETPVDGMPDGSSLLGPGDWTRARAGEPGEIADTTADDPAFLIFTSGTSGNPRGVLHAQRSAHARRMMWRGWYGLGAGDRVLHAGAFNWTYTLGAGLTDPWAAGATALIYAGPRDPGVWPRLIEAHGATIFAAVPGVYRQMLKHAEAGPIAMPTLRHGLTAGERLTEGLAAEWHARTGLRLHEALGMSEISTYISGSPDRPAPPGSCGTPQPGRRVAILPHEAGETPLPRGETGLLAVSRRDPGMMLGYWRDEAATAAAFRGEWFVTGDLAAMAADGAIRHHGRADDVMNALGYRVSPDEVETALAGHPAIAEIAVAELPVRADLTLIAAFVVPAGRWPGEEALAGFAADRLAGYKCPRLWIEVESLPRTPNGKLRRRDLVAAHRRDRSQLS